MSYNGWSNRATWNVKLWLDNDEGTYREVQTLQRRADDKPELAQQLRDLCYSIWPTKQTPDGDPLSECDWDEVAEATWEDEDHEDDEPLIAEDKGHFDTHDFDDATSACKRCGQNGDECYKADCEGIVESTPNPSPSAEPDPADDPIFQPLGKFIEDNAIRMDAHRVPTRPDGLMSDSKNPMRHFRCVLSRTKLGVRGKLGVESTMGVYFSQGSAHIELPTVADVLDCLASDASSFDSANTFEDWAQEFGYDTDSRTAEKTFKAIKRQSEQLKRFLGPEAFDILLYKVERL